MAKSKVKIVLILAVCLMIFAASFLVRFNVNTAVYATVEATLNKTSWRTYIESLDATDAEALVTARNVSDITNATSVGTNVYAKYNTTTKQIVLFSNVDSPIYLPADSSYCFCGGKGEEYWDIDTGANDAYCSLAYVKSIDLTYVDTQRVNSMERMFESCILAETINVSSFVTENVENMFVMFADCPSLRSLNLSGFETSNVSDFRGMFEDTPRIASLDLSSFTIKSEAQTYDMLAFWLSSYAGDCSHDELLQMVSQQPYSDYFSVEQIQDLMDEYNYILSDDEEKIITAVWVIDGLSRRGLSSELFADILSAIATHTGMTTQQVQSIVLEDRDVQDALSGLAKDIVMSYDNYNQTIIAPKIVNENIGLGWVGKYYYYDGSQYQQQDYITSSDALRTFYAGIPSNPESGVEIYILPSVLCIVLLTVMIFHFIKQTKAI